MKTKEKLNVLKENVEVLNKKLAELTEKDQKQVTGYGPEPEPPHEKMKKLYCRECGYVYGIFPEGTDIPVPPIPCSQCKAKPYYSIKLDDAKKI